MSIWVILFFFLFAALLIPLGWAVAHAVGMEHTNWRRAILFAGCEALVGAVAMEAMPINIFVLKVLVGVLAALLVSPLCFRAMMTSESARALLGSMLLAVLGTALLFVAFVIL